MRLHVLIPTLALLSPFAALAQFGPDEEGVSVDMGTAGGGLRMDIRVRGDGQDTQQVQVQAQSSEVVEVDNERESFKLAYDLDASGDTRFKVLAPEGLGIRVTEGWTTVVQDTIPVSFAARNGTFYRFEIFAPSGQVVFDKKLEAKGGRIAQLWVRPTSAPVMNVTVQTTVAPPPPPAPAPAAPTCMSGRELGSLTSQIEEESFSDGKLRVLETAAPHRWFCASQVVQVLEAFDFGSDQLKALEVVAPQIVDPENNHKIYRAFDFDSDKNKAKAILSN